MTTNRGPCDCERCRAVRPSLLDVVAEKFGKMKAEDENARVLGLYNPPSLSREAVRKERAEATVRVSQPAEACSRKPRWVAVTQGSKVIHTWSWPMEYEFVGEPGAVPMSVLPASTLERVRGLPAEWKAEEGRQLVYSSPSAWRSGYILATNECRRALLAALEEEA